MSRARSLRRAGVRDRARLRIGGRCGAISLGLAVLVAVSGCSGTSDDLDVSSVGLPAQDVDHWLMPVDAYIPQSDMTVSYAENVLIGECMEAAGYAWEVPVYDIHAPLAATRNAARRTLFSSEIAATWGYLSAPDTQENAAAQAEFEARPLPDGSEDTFEHCRDQVRADDLPLASGEAMNFAAALGIAADEAARLDPDVLDAAGAWRTCMTPLGISDLPDSPAEMPTVTLTQTFGRGSGEADVDLSDLTPSAYEIEVATADAACRESSGWTQARYEAEWTRQVTAVEQNADALERIRAENDEVAARARAVLAARGLG